MSFVSTAAEKRDVEGFIAGDGGGEGVENTSQTHVLSEGGGEGVEGLTDEEEEEEAGE